MAEPIEMMGWRVLY